MFAFVIYIGIKPNHIHRHPYTHANKHTHTAVTVLIPLPSCVDFNYQYACLQVGICEIQLNLHLTSLIT